MGDRIVVMKDGFIQQVDTPQNLYDYPCNMFVAGFIGSPQMNFLDATLVKEGDNYYVDLGGDKLLINPKKVTPELAAYVGKAIKAGIRPEDIKDCLLYTSVPAAVRCAAAGADVRSHGESVLCARVCEHLPDGQVALQLGGVLPRAVSGALPGTCLLYTSRCV